jgi:hypothetical protein
MKKLLALVLALMLTVACSTVAFADTKSVDEAVSVTSIEVTKLPDKLVYDDYDVDWDVDFETIDNFDELLNANMLINFSTDGGEITATYSDGSTKVYSLENCELELAETITFGDIMNYETEDELNAAVYRDYEVIVTFEGAQTSYTITLEDADDNYESNYELVSFTNPDKMYYTKDDIEELYFYDSDTDEEYESYGISPDATGMTAVLMNKTTGELVTVDEDNIFLYEVSIDDVDETNQILTVSAEAFVDVDDEYLEYDYVNFEFEVYYNTETAYEFVSYSDPNAKEYVIGEDTYIDTYVDPAGNEMPALYVNFDLSGMTVTVKNKATGELKVYGEDSIEINFLMINPQIVPKIAGSYYATGIVTTDDGSTVNFDYTVKLVEPNEGDNQETTAPTTGSSDSTSSTSATTKPASTSDTAASTNSSAVQTGDTMPAMFTLAVLACGVVVAFFYKRKITA